VHVRTSCGFPEQLLLREDADGFWQERNRSCSPVPHVEVHAVQSDQPVQPIAPKSVASVMPTVVDIQYCVYTHIELLNAFMLYVE